MNNRGKWDIQKIYNRYINYMSKYQKKIPKTHAVFSRWRGVMFLWRWHHRWHRGSLQVQTYSETMGTQGYSSTKHIFLCEWEEISNCTIAITSFGDGLHGWHNGQLRQMYWIDGLCWKLLQLHRLDAMVQYTRSMRRYRLYANYLQLKDMDQNKEEALYIDWMPKATRNIAGFINSTQPGYTLKQTNYIFEGCEGNRFFVCAIKSIVAKE